MGSKKKEITDYGIIVVIIIIIALFFSFLFKKSERDKVIAEHEKLSKEIEKDKALKKRLDKKFKRRYLFVRITLVLLWFAFFVITIYLKWFPLSIKGFLIYSQIILLLLITANFIISGSISNIHKFVKFIKAKTEIWVYKKNINLGEKIITKEEKKIELEKERKKHDSEIEEIKDTHQNILDKLNDEIN